jgi:hypothetical protein
VNEGLWLQRFRGGVPFQVTNWSGVLAHLESYEFRPTFVADEEGAWRSLSAEAAERFQAILRYLGIESEIVPAGFPQGREPGVMVQFEFTKPRIL